ncbi:MAG: aminopeptidase P family protein [Planctomycetaceae bacterium]|nr:aminopeptidase P family protein [Planctomycetaceae bacterium]
MTSLTETGCRTRRERLWKTVPADVEWVLIADPRHVQYLANFWVQPLSFSGGERGLLLLERAGRASLMADNFTVRSAVHDPFVDREIVTPWYDHRHAVRNRDHALFDAVKQVAPELAGRKGLVEAEWLPLAAAQLLPNATTDDMETSSLDLGTILRNLRRQKEPDEIELLKVCMRAGDAGQARLREILRPGLSELEIYLEVQKAALEAAGRPGLVYGDFRGTNGQNIKAGGLPTDYVLREGDLFILDYSVVLDGYRSDFTNTMAVGPPSAAVQELFGYCQAGMAAAEKRLKAGAACRDVHAAAAGAYPENGKSVGFTHHAGHGIGLAHPEAPLFVPESDETLLAGDVVTLEPGAYVKDVGGMRIEHNYLITDDGYERLSHHVISLT